MANMTFGVNLIPKNSNNTQQTLGNSENKWDIYAEDLVVDNINGKTPITGVKGAANETYKTGEVNLTPADLGIPSTNATQSTNGFMSSSDKIKLDGIEEGAEVNSITGIKGNAEANYRTGNINLTPENIGAKVKQTAVSDPTANGTAVEFIDSISQNTEGVITPTKKTVATVTTSTNGLMSSTDKTKLDGIEAGAQVNSVTGIKGNEENTYRTGNINLTSANIGAKIIQTAVTDPIAEGTSIEFIDSISQNAQGVIAPTKKNVATATTSTAGLMSAADKTKLNGIETGAEVNPDIANNLIETTAGKVLDATQGKVLNDTKLDKDFNFTAATLPYSNNEKLVLQGTDGNNYYTTIGELASQIGGSGGGTSQTALVHYVKNCGTISSLNWTNPTIDNNITENMVVLKAELSNPAAQTSDWTCTTTNGYVTISGTISGSTNVLLYFGVSLSTAPSIIVNLASNSSDNVLKTNPTPGVMGVLGTTNGGTGVNATDFADLRSKLGITPASIGAVNKAGDIMTGSLAVQSNTIALADTTKGNTTMYMHIASNKMGIYSNGYYNGSNFVSDDKWLVQRDTNGVVRLGNVVPTDNGGTGVSATDAADLRSKLGITPANIGALPNTTFTLYGLANVEFQYGGDSWVQRIIFDLNGTNKSMFEITMREINYGVSDDGGVNWQNLWTTKTITYHDTYTHANGAVVNCYRSGNVVTVHVTGIGSVTNISSGSDFNFDTGMDEKYRPIDAMRVYGTASGNWNYTGALIYFINTTGYISGYAYQTISSGGFTITYVV